MGYQKQNGGFADTVALNLLNSTAAAVTVTGAAIELGDRGTARLTLAVPAAAVGTLDVTLETSEDGVNNWATVAAFTQVTTTPGTQRKRFSGLDKFVRGVATIGAGGTYTFTLSGDAC